MPFTYASDDSRHALRFAEWPEQDLAAWRQVTHPGDLLGDAGPLAQLGSRSLQDHKAQYGHWLGFCAGVERGCLSQAASARITESRVGAYVKHLKGYVAPYTALGRVRSLARLAAAFAPDADWRWLRRIVARLDARAGPIRPKLPLLRPTRELVDAGIRTMKEAEVMSSRTQRMPAVHFRNGLMLATLAARPLRARNFTALSLGRHLYRAGAGWMIDLAGSDTKTGREYEVPYPELLDAYLGRYLDHWRPQLLSSVEASSRLWISWRGCPLDYQDVHRTIRGITLKQFGIAMHPHIFRDCLATSVALEDPVNMGVATALLGHRWLETVNRYYNQARQMEAAAAVQTNVEQRRRKARRARMAA